MKFLAPAIATAVTLLASTVSAHGYVNTALIAGKTYTFYQPYADPYMNPPVARISRPIQGNGPVENVAISDVQCGGYAAGGQPGSSPAALHAEVAAGSDVKLFWTLWPDSHVGPTITYMAKCPDSGCDKWMPGDKAVWFKVQEDGRSGTSNTWGASALMKDGGSVTYTVPKCIAPGYYLVRHEIIALHSAYTYPGAQFYPGCHQLKVTGGGNATPAGLVAFPGAYKAADPGITVDAYKAQAYTIPGPKKFIC